MKRVIKSRLKKVILSEWQNFSPTDPDIYQYLTDAMTNGYPVQINYEGSGWRSIQPYGWNTSKEKSNGEGGNVLLMCYKDSGEIRSYRFDKITDIYIDMDGNQIATSDNEQMMEDQQMEYYEDIMNENYDETENFMPQMLSENEEEIKNNGVYDNQLDNFYNDEGDVINEMQI